MYDVLRPLDILSSRKLSRLSPEVRIGSHGLFHTVDDSLVCVIGIDSSKIDRNVSACAQVGCACHLPILGLELDLTIPRSLKISWSCRLVLAYLRPRTVRVRNLYETSIPPNWPKWPLASIFSISSGCGLRVKVQV